MAQLVSTRPDRASRSKPRGSLLRRLASDEAGSSSIEFVIIFPVFFSFFLMTFESGMMSVRHMMLERGVDIAVRDVRTGQMISPTRETLLERICDVATIIPDCLAQVELEMTRRDPRNWANVPEEVACIDRSVNVQPVVEFNTGGSNELVFLRACARIDPFFPTTGLGKAVTRNTTQAAQGSYALVASSAFVIEPFAPE